MTGPEELLAPVRAYLEAPRCVVISTVGSGGSPHQAVVHYLVEDAAILVNGRPERLWARNLRRDPRISLVVHDAERPLHWVGIKGAVGEVREGQTAVEEAMRMAARYGEDPNDYRDLERVSFLIRPERVFEYG
jgi:PPOX class probable F420-dependent enzyme